jgi:hypothetical protein
MHSSERNFIARLTQILKYIIGLYAENGLDLSCSVKCRTFWTLTKRRLKCLSMVPLWQGQEIILFNQRA